MSWRNIFYPIIMIVIGAVGVASAKYRATEIQVIPWGDGIDQLPIHKAQYDPTLLPEDSIMNDAEGPNLVFVDRLDNIYVASTYMLYLKGFDKTGAEIANIVGTDPYANSADYYDQIDSAYADSAEYDSYNMESADISEPEIGQPYEMKSIYALYVDSLANIYIEGSLDNSYIAVVDYDGYVVDRLASPTANEGGSISNLKWSSDDVLTFIDGLTYDYLMYRNGEITRADNSDWLAKDHFFYFIGNPTDTTITFTRTGDASFDNAYYDSLEAYERPLETGDAVPTLLGVSDDMRVFVHLQSVGGAAKAVQRIRVYDQHFNELDEFVMPARPSNKYDWQIDMPFLRPSDGSIYEFRCKDDGLHVMKWNQI